ncbi:putative sodium/metabolite cotransporter [Chlorella vulgaris]
MPRQRLQPRRSLQPLAATAAAAASPSGSSKRTPLQALGSFASNNFIPLGLVLAIVCGWFFPAVGVAAAEANAQLVATVFIFIISGLLLQRGETAAALRATSALAYGLLAILAVTPLAAFGVLRLPLAPKEVALGLAVFCCMPTTLSTGVTLTVASSGNAAVALLLTVASNMLAVFTIPPLLSLVLGSGAGVANFDAAALFRNLVSTVLLPLLAGASLQAVIPGAHSWKKNHRKLLSYVSAVCLCTVPFMQVSKASAARLPLTPTTLAMAAAAALGLHLVLLSANLLATRLVRFDPDPAQHIAIRKAVVLCSSQKTLPVAVAVLTQLSGVLGAGVGFAVIPCVLAHLIQTVFDSAVVSRWNAREAAGLPAMG